jgi:hypothetical protein
MKTYRQWLDAKPRTDDPRRCPVCGHRSLTPIRSSLNWLMLILLGAALGYIALDIAEDGRLDGSIFRLISAGIVSPASAHPPPSETHR